MITRRQARRRRWTLRFLLFVALLPAVVWGVVPKEPVDTAITFDPAELGEDPVAGFLARDAAFEDITPGTERTILWAGEEGAATELVLVYIHGFSATLQEIRPVPDAVAAALGANLVFTRLTGHGRGSAALAEPRVADWMRDLDEALAVARSIGERVVVISTSTGGTLTTMGLATGRAIDGAIFVSPNFQIKDPKSRVLTLPGARYWVPALFGRTRSWEPLSEAHGRYWTTSYPTEALFPLAALVAAVDDVDPSDFDIPALFYFSDADTVVEAARTREVAEAWGGSATVIAVDLGPEDDVYGHVIAGEVRSPGRHDETVADFTAWIGALE